MKNIYDTHTKNSVSDKPAFTLLELIMVIIVLGILAALAFPRMERDTRQEAADNVLSAIRYTQHMALMDNRHKFDSADWQKSLWQIRFSNPSDTWVYTIASNIDYASGTNLDQDESAIDPMNSKYMHSSDHIIDIDESPNIFLTDQYNIDDIVFNGCAGSSASNAKHIAFDYLGRPHRGVTQGATNDYATYVSNSNCEITFSSPAFDSSFTIEITRETGHAFIVGQEDS